MMKNWRGLGKCGWLLAVLIFLGGCSREDTDRLAKIGKIAGQRLEWMVGDLEEDMYQRLQQSRQRRQKNQLALQIAQRLKADKSLAGCKVQLAIDGNQIELKGTAKDMEQRQRIIDIVRAVPGVGGVRDSLKIVEKAK